ncbi:hypothetical protein D3C72_431830 [compost metagenome]
MLAKIIHSHFSLVLTSDQQKMLKAHLPDGGTFTGNLVLVEGFTLDAVTHGKAAVGAIIGAKIGEIKWHVKAHRVAKALTSEPLRALRHRLKIRASSGGEQGHHVLAGHMPRIQGALDVCGGFAVDPQTNVVPVQLAPSVDKGAHEYASRKPVSGLVACA